MEEKGELGGFMKMIRQNLRTRQFLIDMQELIEDLTKSVKEKNWFYNKVFLLRQTRLCESFTLTHKNGQVTQYLRYLPVTKGIERWHLGHRNNKV